MITTEAQNWTSRILEQGRVGAAPENSWKLKAYEQYKESCVNPFIHASSGRPPKRAGRCSIPS